MTATPIRYRARAIECGVTGLGARLFADVSPGINGLQDCNHALARNPQPIRSYSTVITDETSVLTTGADDLHECPRRAYAKVKC